LKSVLRVPTSQLQLIPPIMYLVDDELGLKSLFILSSDG